MKIITSYSISLLLLTSPLLYSHVVEVTTEESFSEILTSGKKAVVKFSATWCGPCQRIKEPFKKLSDEEQFKDVTFAAVDIDQLKKLSSQQGISSVPSFVYIVDGKVIDKDTGAPDNLEQRIQEALTITDISITNKDDVAEQLIVSTEDTPVVTQTDQTEKLQHPTFFDSIKTKINNMLLWVKNMFTTIFPGR